MVYAHSCPSSERKNDCPLIEQKYLSFPGKVDWIKSLDFEKQGLNIQHHIECSGNRGISN